MHEHDVQGKPGGRDRLIQCRDQIHDGAHAESHAQSRESACEVDVCTGWRHRRNVVDWPRVRDQEGTEIEGDTWQGMAAWHGMQPRWNWSSSSVLFLPVQSLQFRRVGAHPSARRISLGPSRRPTSRQRMCPCAHTSPVSVSALLACTLIYLGCSSIFPSSALQDGCTAYRLPH